MAGIAVSHGSACASGGLEPSPILINMGIPPSLARTSLRFSLSRFTTEEDIDTTIEIVSSYLMKFKK
jgi:cysteine desulfurase